MPPKREAVPQSRRSRSPTQIATVNVIDPDFPSGSRRSRDYPDYRSDSDSDTEDDRNKFLVPAAPTVPSSKPIRPTAPSEEKAAASLVTTVSAQINAAAASEPAEQMAVTTAVDDMIAAQARDRDAAASASARPARARAEPSLQDEVAAENFKPHEDSNVQQSRRVKLSAIEPVQQRDMSYALDEACRNAARAKVNFSGDDTARALWQSVQGTELGEQLKELLAHYLLVVHYVFTQPAFTTFYGNLVGILYAALAHEDSDYSVQELTTKLLGTSMASTSGGDSLQDIITAGIIEIRNYAKGRNLSVMRQLIASLLDPSAANQQLSTVILVMKANKVSNVSVLAVERLAKVFAWLDYTLSTLTSELRDLGLSTKRVQRLLSATEKEPRTSKRDLQIILGEYVLCRTGYNTDAAGFLEYIKQAYNTRGVMHITWSIPFFELLRLAFPCRPGNTSNLFTLQSLNSYIYGIPEYVMYPQPTLCVTEKTRADFEELGRKAVAEKFMDESYEIVSKQLETVVTAMEL